MCADCPSFFILVVTDRLGSVIIALSGDQLYKLPTYHHRNIVRKGRLWNKISGVLTFRHKTGLLEVKISVSLKNKNA